MANDLIIPEFGAVLDETDWRLPLFWIIANLSLKSTILQYDY